MKRAVTTLPLHYGRAPRWLFDKMKRLSAAITSLILLEFGPREFLRRLSDPVWFQAFGCVLGFDWHSSGVTTTVCGAVKEGIRGMDHELGFFVAGGKGAAKEAKGAGKEAKGGGKAEAKAPAKAPRETRAVAPSARQAKAPTAAPPETPRR